MRNDIIFFAAVVAIALISLAFLSYHESVRYVEISAQNTTKVVSVEIAGDPISYERGLMGRKTLDKDSGMLFVFNDELKRAFWMKNTLISLDIIFVSSNYTIVDMKEKFMPCESDPCPVYSSAAPAKFVIEVNAGFVEEHGIETGNKIKIR
jgi:uncharacterized membrane protein (UPF0127 family)